MTTTDQKTAAREFVAFWTGKGCAKEQTPAKDNLLRLTQTAHGIFQPPPCQGGPVTNIVGAG